MKYDKNKTYYYQKRPVKFIRTDGDKFHFEIVGGAKLIIDRHKLDELIWSTQGKPRN